jgi:hypothetical protein
MPIPAFANDVLPPHTGDPRRREQLSPFPCTTTELCQRFATTPERLAILDGFPRFRELLAQAGFVSGFQWVDGSFLENIGEIPIQGRQPLRTTIDLTLQETAYHALKDENRRGAIILMRPDTGALVVLATCPSYDNNLAVGGFNGAVWRKLSVWPMRIWLA